MFRQIIAQWQARRRQRAKEELLAWRQLCGDIARACGEALGDESIKHGRSGELLDKIDRMLFGLRDHIPGHRFGRHSSELASRMREISEQIYRLRNQTARFLIRCQGPAPTLNRLERTLDSAYYYQALDEFGYEARRLWQELENALTEIDEEIRRVTSELDFGQNC